MTEIERARAEQLAYHGAEADRFGVLLSQGLDRLGDWTYRHPASTALSTWRGVTRWAGVDQSYRWHIDREILLQQGKGPFYCPTCHDRPAVGWKALACYDCAWEGHLAVKALEVAQSLGETWERYHAKEKAS